MEQVVDTMLHELSHNVHGPHDEKFHALWDQLRKEYEALISKGYTGEGFLSKGNRLGGRSVPRDEARRIARAAAERRQALTTGSGQKLGGRGIRVGDDVRRVIADAAERRVMIEKGCGSHNKNLSEREVIEIADEAEESGFKTKAEEDAANDQAIAQALWDLVQEDEKEKFGNDYVEPSASNPAGSQEVNEGNEGKLAQPRHPGQSTTETVPAWKRTRQEAKENSPTSKSRLKTSSSLSSNSRLVTSATKNPKSTSSSSSTRPASKPRKSEYFQPVSPPRPVATIPAKTTPIPTPQSLSTGWTCDICTLHNPLNYLCCDACGTERSESVTEKAVMDQRRRDEEQKRERERRERENAIAQSSWRCPYCTMVMEAQWWTCSSCGSMKDSS